MTPFSVLSLSEGATRALGQALGRALVPGLTVLLDGGLGMGKTVLVRGVGDALGASGVRSPSFTLVNEYRTNTGLFLVHADLYRLEPGDSDAVDALGLDEYGLLPDAVLFVEWPDRWDLPPKKNILSVNFSAPNEQQRLLRFNPTGEKAEKTASLLLDALAREPGCKIL